jgi:hypothetical protein
MPEAAVRGHALFMGKARCAICHPPPLFTDDKVHRTGFGEVAKIAAAPSGPVTMTSGADGTFRTGASKTSPSRATRTPSLRMLAETGPYGTSNHETSLEKTVEFMTSGGKPVVLGYVLCATAPNGMCPQYGRNTSLDPEFLRAPIGKSDILDLLAFLGSLDGSGTSGAPSAAPAK